MGDVKGVKLWNKANTYYSQENNPTEAYNKAVMNNRGGWLESCGPTAAVNCLAAMGLRVYIICPGIYEPQPEEVLMDFFNDPRNAVKLTEVRDLKGFNIPKNRVPQYYPLAVLEVFGVEAQFSWGVHKDIIFKALDNGQAVQLCLKSPGHFIAVVAHEDDTLIYNDSWGSRFKDGNGGFNRRVDFNEIHKNLQPYHIVYKGLIP